MGSHALLQGSFPTQGIKPMSLCPLQVLYHYCHLGIHLQNSTNFPLHFSWKFRPGSEMMVLIEEKSQSLIPEGFLSVFVELGICSQCDQQSSCCQSWKWSRCLVPLLPNDATLYWELTCGHCTSVLPHLQVQVWVKTSLSIFQGGDAMVSLVWKSRNREISEQL